MGETNIEWADVTWNPVSGCTKVSAGCKHCYAETVANRFWGHRKFTDVRCHDNRLDQPFHWRKPRRIFVNSMSDLFHEAVPRDFIYRVLRVVEQCPQHQFLVLTKRAKAMRDFFWGESGAGASVDPLPNLWLGVSCENQATADERIPYLIQTPAAVRFISAEPLLGRIMLGLLGTCPKTWGLGGYRLVYEFIHWVIVGGESGFDARPCDVTWIRAIIEQCKAAGVPVFVKQLGARPFDPMWHGDGDPVSSRMRLNDAKGGDMSEWSKDLQVRQWPEVQR